MEKKWLTTKQKAEHEQLSTKQVLRRAREGLYKDAYQAVKNGVWRFSIEETPILLPRTLTNEELVIEEKRKQALFKHQKDLHAVASHWKSQLWLPLPWQWDISHLDYVFYVDREKSIAGYKLPAELLGSEDSKGHFRHFDKGDVYWTVQKDGVIILKLPVEDEAAFGHLQAHTQYSPAWGIFAEWKKEAGNYIQLCASLLARIEQDVKRAIRTKDELSWWSIYHDSFCLKDTKYRCQTCGTPNVPGSRFCQACHLPLGWLQPILKGFERTTENPQSSPIHIGGWGNIEESVENKQYEGMTRGHTDLKDKHRGHDLVEVILEAENQVKQVEAQLKAEFESLSQKRVFPGKCPLCSGS